MVTFASDAMVPLVDLDGKIVMPKTSEISIVPAGAASLIQKVNEDNDIKQLLLSCEFVQLVNSKVAIFDPQ